MSLAATSASTPAPAVFVPCLRLLALEEILDDGAFNECLPTREAYLGLCADAREGQWDEAHFDACFRLYEGLHGKV